MGINIGIKIHSTSLDNRHCPLKLNYSILYSIQYWSTVFCHVSCLHTPLQLHLLSSLPTLSPVGLYSLSEQSAESVCPLCPTVISLFSSALKMQVSFVIYLFDITQEHNLKQQKCKKEEKNAKVEMNTHAKI